MKYQNYQIYLSHYWELLGEMSLEESYSRAEIAMGSENTGSGFHNLIFI